MAADATIEKGPAGLAAPRDHEADGVVAIGGASPMDTAKAAAVAFAKPGDVRDYAGYNQVSPGVLNAGPPRVQFPLTFKGPAESITVRRTAVRMANREVR